MGSPQSTFPHTLWNPFFSVLLKEWIGTVIIAATLLLVTLLLLNQRFVRIVPESGPDATHYLVGAELSDLGRQVSAALGTPSDVEIIKQAGYDQIPVLWSQYAEVSLAYTVVFCAFVVVGALAVTGSLSYIPERSPARDS